MPQLNEANVRHLLRRTEIVDRNDRVAYLLTLGTLEAAVDDVMNVDTNPPSVSLPAGMSDWDLNDRFVAFWLDRMAFTPRPFGERMAFFWHGHIVSDYVKAYGAVHVRDQINLFRRAGLTDIGGLLKTAAVQTVMLRYLDNDQNFASSPNQNFARELMELFTLGVGNYNESDVEAATAAWTGHTADKGAGVYRFDPALHEQAPQLFLGQWINGSGEHESAGRQTIDVILQSGVVPGDAAIVEHRGQPTKTVAADFLSRKLWQEFGEAASGGVPEGVAGAMRSALVSTGFSIRPWVRAMLTHDDFYAETTKSGLIRQPVEYAVAVSAATGVGVSDELGHLWLLRRAGQAPTFCPDVSGWKPNGYWVNSSAMEARNRIAQGSVWNRLLTYWKYDYYGRDRNYIELAKGRMYGSEIFGWESTPPMTSTQFVDRLLALTDLDHGAPVRQELISFCNSVEDSSYWIDALLLILISPQMHLS